MTIFSELDSERNGRQGRDMVAFLFGCIFGFIIAWGICYLI